MNTTIFEPILLDNNFERYSTKQWTKYSIKKTQTSQSLIQSIFWCLLRRPYEVISSDIHRIHWTSWTRSINSLGDKINSAFSFCLVERYLKKKQIRKEFPTLFYYQKTRGFDLFSKFKIFFVKLCKKQLSLLLGRYDLYGR